MEGVGSPVSRNKALSVLGTSEKKMVLMKTLGITAEELEVAVDEATAQTVTVIREQKDKEVLGAIKGNKNKGLNTLGINLAYPRLQKQFGIDGDELELALKEAEICRLEREQERKAEAGEDSERTPGSLCAKEKIALIDSEKLQKVFGLDPRIVRLMHILGASEEQILEYLRTDNQEEEGENDIDVE